MIPEKKSKKWFYVFILYTMITLVCFLISIAILKSDVIFSLSYDLILFFISISAAVIPSIGGYLGKKVFFKASTISIVYAILYNFDVVINKTASGWEELTTIVGFVCIVGVGTFIAIVAELIAFTIRYFRRK